jgi:hypothetical protein
MLRPFIDVLRGNEPLGFESDFDLHESVRRLASEVKSPLLEMRPIVSFRAVVVVGNVAEEHVSLWCERLLISNGFRPVFLGRFQFFDKRVILIGNMVGMNGLVHLFVGAGLAMGLFFTLGTLLELIKGNGSDDPALWVMPFGGVLPVLFVLGLVRFGRWLSSSDEDWILAAIRSALLKSVRTSDT